MSKKPMTLLLIEDDSIECQNYIDYVEESKEAEIVKITNSSKQGIEYFNLYMPEAIILDIELHKGEGSGLEFLEEIKKYTEEFKPIIVVITNASSNILYNKLHEEGVELVFYKKQKDYSPKLVISSVLSLREILHKYGNQKCNNKKETKAEKEEKLSIKIDTELNIIGISPHLKGRKYIHDAIMYLLKEKDNEQKETVFNYLSSSYKRSSSSISRVMQTAINYAWRTSSPEDLETYYTAKINYHTGVPTPTEFIYYYFKKIDKTL